MSFFRYPGGKGKLSTIIVNRILAMDGCDYCEPFFGGGSIGLRLIEKKVPFRKYHFNDIDAGIISIWKSVYLYPELLKQRINEVKISVGLFFDIKNALLNNNILPKDKEGVVDLAVKKIAVHQMSYSGLGTQAGGPIGGLSQRSDYSVDCRWSPRYMCKKIDRINSELQGLNIDFTCDSYADVLGRTMDETLIYLDPPYYTKGSELYQYKFSEKDHELLAYLLKKSGSIWLLSYDNCAEIKHLYNWATIEEIKVNYTINTIRNNTELLIQK